MNQILKTTLTITALLCSNLCIAQKTAVKAKTPVKAPVKTVTAPPMAGSTYLRYELNGRKVEIKKADLLNYAKDVKDADNGDHSLVNLFVSSSVKEDYKMSIMFYSEFMKKPVVGKLGIGSIMVFKEGLPSVHVKCDKYVNEKFTFFGTQEEAEGLVEVTKVEGDWIEGKFELNIPESYSEDPNSMVRITNGSFRFKMDKAELEN